MTTFAERLRRLRHDAGLSQTQLAGDGLSPSYISLLESGKRSPSTEVAAQLARKLGCSTSLLLEGEPSERERRIELEMAYGRLALEHGQAQSARERLVVLLSEEGLPLHVQDEAELLLCRAHVLVGDLEAAVTVLLPLYERARTGSTQLPLPAVGMQLTWLYVQLGSAHQAVVVGEQAIAACRDQGLAGTEEFYRLAATLMAAYADLGDDVHASRWAQQLIAEAEQAGVRDGQAALYWNAAVIAERRGRIDEALQLCRQAMAHLSELDDSVDLARVRVAAAVILLAADPPDVGEAVAALERTRELLADLGDVADLAEWDFARSWAALLLHDVDGAEAFARSSVQRVDELDDVDAALLGRAHLALGDALAARGRPDEAREHLVAARSVFDRLSTGRVAAYSWRELAERLAHAGDLPGAADAFRRSLDAASVRDRSRAVLAAVDAARSVLSTAQA